ncbi:MAG: NAD-dependent deacylase [Bacteroidales bacterium]|nr:NAD-dependent deacylase [Bacteroidales bacterium]
MIDKAAKIIRNSKHLVAHTGAGISVESGIPPYRGEGGIWNKYDTKLFDSDYFKTDPEKCWELIRITFLEIIKNAKPNLAHYKLVELEKMGILKSITTQNIDNLHYLAGSKNVIEFHGNSRQSICEKCGNIQQNDTLNLHKLPPKCTECNGILKPDFVFFGEAIPIDAMIKSELEFGIADTVLIIGTTGMVYPAAELPFIAKEKGAKIIEINTEESNFTKSITDIFLKGKASEIMDLLFNVV